MRWFPHSSARKRLGVDFGTSSTVAVSLHRDAARPLMFDDSPLLPSAVFYSTEDHLLTGADAVYASTRHPERYEPNPKRMLGTGPVLLGDREFDAVELVAPVLARIAAEHSATEGAALAVPVTWGPHRRALLVEAAARAGLGAVSLVEEPVAAAAFYHSNEPTDTSGPSTVVVYDLGAGTCDLAVLRCDGERLEVVAVDGIDGCGGLDIDAAVVEYVAAQAGISLNDAADRRTLMNEARLAKERLSRATSADIGLPGAREHVHLTRGELDSLAEPLISATVRAAERVIAGLPGGSVDRLYLVGGASRMPLVSTMLHRALDITPTVTEQPQLAVAEGCLLVDSGVPDQVDPNDPMKHRGIDYRPHPSDRSEPFTEALEPASPSPLSDTGDAGSRSAPRGWRRVTAIAAASGILLALLVFLVPRLLEQGPDLEGVALVVGDQAVTLETIDSHLDWLSEYHNPGEFDHDEMRPWVIRWFLIMRLGEQLGLSQPDLEPEDGAAYKPYFTADIYFHEMTEQAEPREPSGDEIAALAEADVVYDELNADDRNTIKEFAGISDMLRSHIDEYGIEVNSRYGPDVLLVGPELPFSPGEEPILGGVFDVEIPQFSSL